MRFYWLAAVFLSAVSLHAAGALSGRRAPGFSLPDRHMKQHDPQDYRGKPLLVEFMQTGCPACTHLAGILEQVQAKYAGKISLLSVVVPPDTIENVRKYIDAHKVTTPILFDCGQMTASYLRITPQNPQVHFPHLFFIDAEGFIRNDFGHEELQPNRIDARKLSAEIDKLLAVGSSKKR